MPKKAAPQKIKAAAKSSTESTVDIDDIFASKPKKAKVNVEPRSSLPSDAVASSSKVASIPGGNTIDPQKKKKRKAGKAIPAFIPDGEESRAGSNAGDVASSTAATGQKRKVEEVLDPSRPLPSAPPPAAPAASGPVTSIGKGKKKDKRKDEVNEDDLFADSRGTGPRRKTEEGFLIYKEAELQIDPEAGGTPLCPFDCDCCF